jgi:hypothetical protein
MNLWHCGSLSVRRVTYSRRSRAVCDAATNSIVFCLRRKIDNVADLRNVPRTRTYSRFKQVVPRSTRVPCHLLDAVSKYLTGSRVRS